MAKFTESFWCNGSRINRRYVDHLPSQQLDIVLEYVCNNLNPADKRLHQIRKGVSGSMNKAQKVINEIVEKLIKDGYVEKCEFTEDLASAPVEYYKRTFEGYTFLELGSYEFQRKKEKDTEKITGIVQLDEAAVGGKNKNRHKDKKVANSQGRSLKDKTWVFGMVKNDETYARVFVVPDTEMETLMPIIKANIDKSSIIVSDGLTSYSGLEDYYEKHVKVKIDGNYKSEEGYNTNRMEGLWTQLKRMYKGTYHHKSKKHLQRYCDELAYKYNNKSEDDCITFEEAISKIDSRTRLKYRELVGYDNKKRKVKKEDDINTRITHEKYRAEAEFRGLFR